MLCVKLHSFVAFLMLVLKEKLERVERYNLFQMRRRQGRHQLICYMHRGKPGYPSNHKEVISTADLVR